MHVIQSTSTRARRAAVAAALCLCSLPAACGRDGARESSAGAVAPDSAAADTAAMAAARRALGPDVRMAIPFRIPHRNARFIAAALPIMEWVPDVARAGSNAAPGGHELVIVEVVAGSHAVHKPGLYASREPWLPRLDDTATAVPADSATLARTMGVEDADGDGTPEAWAAQYRAGARTHGWEVRAYDRDARSLYQASGSSSPGREGCLAPESYEFSDNAEQNPAIQAWLVRKLEQLNREHAARSGGAAAACPGSAAEAGR